MGVQVGPCKQCRKTAPLRSEDANVMGFTSLCRACLERAIDAGDAVEYRDREPYHGNRTTERAEVSCPRCGCRQECLCVHFDGESGEACKVCGTAFTLTVRTTYTTRLADGDDAVQAEEG